MIDPAALAQSLQHYLPNQRWFGAKDRKVREVVIEELEVLEKDWPVLLSVECEVVIEDNTSERYHVLVGLRPPGQPATFLEGKPDAVMGEFDLELGHAYGYDALRDPELSLRLLDIAVPQNPPPSRVRPVGAEQTNTSLIFDDKVILKVFRKLSEGPNLDLEVTRALSSVGFPHIAELKGEWTRKGTDLGILQRFLAGGAEGWALAITSLRDFFGTGGDPAQAGGDFGAEAERLGEMTASLHSYLSSAFGTTGGDADAWADVMHAQLQRIHHPDLPSEKIGKVFDELRTVEDPGPSLRVHGDYHLGQVMRTDMGWFVLDFEGEPARPIEERRWPSSPLKDVAGMLRSFQYASRSALMVQEISDSELAKSWEQRNRQAFLDGYVAVAYRNGILPSDTGSMDLVLRAYELDKAVYEVGYEMAHRPDWVDIPLDAVTELLGGN